MDHGTLAKHWEQQIKPYEQQPIRLWIEDISGEKKTEPKSCRLEKVSREEPGWLKFYINAHQFLSVPIFGEPDTRLERKEEGRVEAAGKAVGKVEAGGKVEGEAANASETKASVSFISEDKASKLIYRVTFE